jgi:class 3 adenylate cyclase/tetratricopeptide (TPR) repeat protein
VDETTLLEEDDWVVQINTILNSLDKVIEHFGGQVDKHTGQGVMALFGAFEAREDDPESAVRAALVMQKEVQAFSHDHPHTPMQISIGIHTGPVLLGEVGSQREFTAMGDTVNLASRLERAAPVGTVLISRETYRHVRGLFDVQAQPPLTVKGKSDPLQTYQVFVARPRAFRLQTRGVDGVETHMVGRAAELQRLQIAMRAVIETRRLHAITIVGDAGVGKSRLLYEFSAWADLLPENWLIFKGRANEATRHLPYALLRDIFCFRFEIADSDTLAVAREKLVLGFAGFMSGDADAIMESHFIGHLIGFDFSASPYLHGILHDTKQIRDRAFHYLVHFFATLTHEDSPDALVLLLEDIHWADDGSLDAITYLLQNGTILPLLLISLTRPILFEQRPTWGVGSGVWHERMDISLLSAPECSQLVDEILKLASDVPSSLTEMIVNRAEGNPFYVEELIKVLIDEQAIIPGPKRWQIVPERLSTVQIPPTLTGILQTRLDGLPEAEQNALQCASVVGRIFWDKAVAFLEQGPGISAEQTESRDSLEDTLQTLLHRELIFTRNDSAFSGTREYIFKHALLRDVTYDTVLKRLRYHYHLLAATWLIEQSGERVNEYAGLIAEHYDLAREPILATEWYSRAAEQALSTYAPLSAFGYLQKALDLTSTTGAQHAGMVNIYLKLADVLELLGRWDEVEFYCHAALSLSQQLNSNAQNSQGSTIEYCQEKLGQLFVLRGDYGTALGWLEKARIGCESLGDLSGTSRVLTWIGSLYWRKGEYAEARSYLDKGLALARKLNNRLTMAIALNNLGNVCADQGDTIAAKSLYEESLSIKRELGDKRGIASAINNLANVVSDLGDNVAARSLYEECLAQLREIQDKRGMGMVISNLALLVQEQGDLAAALTWHEESLALKRNMGDKPGIALALNNIGIVALEQRDYKAALTHFIEGFSLTIELGDKRIMAYDMVGLAGVAARIGTENDSAADVERATLLAASAENQMILIGATMEAIVRRLCDKVLALAYEHLGEIAYSAAWQAGQNLSTEQILAIMTEML